MSMNGMDRMTRKSQEAVQESVALAESLQHSAIELLHLFFVLMKQEDGVIPNHDI